MYIKALYIQLRGVAPYLTKKNKNLEVSYMAYENEKDVVSFEEAVECGDCTLGVSVHTYNGGEAKLQLNRTMKNKAGEQVFRKLGRLTLPEFGAISPMLNNASKHMSTLA